jgi:peptidyl-prolyl cis-trans isomerase C
MQHGSQAASQRGGRLLRGLAVVYLLGLGVTASGDTPVVAEIGTNQMTLDGFRLILRAMRDRDGIANSLDTLTRAGRSRILERLVDQRVYTAAARQEGIDQQPDVKVLVEQAEAEVLAKAYLDARSRQVVTTDDALRAYYAQHPDDFRAVARVKARHILLQTKSDADEALAALKGGADFAALAAEKSVDANTRNKGGELGWVPRGLMVKPFEDTLFSLKTGQIGGPVQSGYGFHVIRADEVDEGGMPPFDEIREAVRQRLIAADVEQLRQQLRTRYHAKVYPDVLATMEK